MYIICLRNWLSERFIEDWFWMLVEPFFQQIGGSHRIFPSVDKLETGKYTEPYTTVGKT
jgi:hypothetical protein